MREKSREMSLAKHATKEIKSRPNVERRLRFFEQHEEEGPAKNEGKRSEVLMGLENQMECEYDPSSHP